MTWWLYHPIEKLVIKCKSFKNILGHACLKGRRTSGASFTRSHGNVWEGKRSKPDINKTKVPIPV
jgi:hypothetical protein